MNSFRAFKLKLPKREVEDEHGHWDVMQPYQNQTSGNGSVGLTLLSGEDERRKALNGSPYFQSAQRSTENSTKPQLSDFLLGGTKTPLRVKLEDDVIPPPPINYFPHAVENVTTFDPRFQCKPGSRISNMLPQLTNNLSDAKNYEGQKITSPFSHFHAPSKNQIPFTPTPSLLVPKYFSYTNARVPMTGTTQESKNSSSPTNGKHGNVTLSLPSPPPSDNDICFKSTTSPCSTDSGYPDSVDHEVESKCKPTITKLDEEKKEGCFQCSFCQRTFSYLCHLKVHERVHTGEKPYSCKYCSQQFSQLGSLTVHMRIHTGAKPYQCGQCSKKFRHVNSLRRHQRQVHLMEGNQITSALEKREKIPLATEENKQTYTYTHSGFSHNNSSEASTPKRRRESFPPRHSLNFQFESKYEQGDSSMHLQMPHYKFEPDRTRYAQLEAVPNGTFHINHERSHAAIAAKIESNHHKSKFIQELEMKSRQRMDEGSGEHNREAANTLLSLSTPRKDNSAEPLMCEKPKVVKKTWRPFLSDSEEETNETPPKTSICHKDETPRHNSAQSNSWSSLRFTCAGNVMQNDVIRRNVENEEASMEQKQDNTHGQNMLRYWYNSRESPMTAPYLWHSSLSLQSPYISEIIRASSGTALPEINQEKAVDRNEETVDNSKNKSLEFSSEQERSSPVEVKVERDGNTSDEGFSSSCSTTDGNSKSRRPSLDHSSLTDESMNISDIPTTSIQCENQTVKLNAKNECEDTSHRLQTSLVNSRQVLAKIKQERVDEMGRKWSEDSGIEKKSQL